METNLRPLTLGEILDRTAQLYRTNFPLFAGIYAVYAGVTLVLSLIQIGLTAWLKGPQPSVGTTLLLGTTAVAEGLLLFLFAGAVIAAINRAVAWVHLGEPATIRSAYLTTLPRLGRYMWLMTITAFIIWAPFLIVAFIAGVVVALIPGIFSGRLTSDNPQSILFLGLIFGVFALLMIPWIVYAVLMALRYSLAVPACVVENLTARKAIRRSIELSKGARGRIFVMGLLILVIDLVLVVPTQGFFAMEQFKHLGQPVPVWMQALQQVIAFFTNAFLGPIYATGITLFYYDQRVRREGYDIEWMMQAAGLTPPVRVAEPPAVVAGEPTVDEPSLALDPNVEPTLAPPRDPPEEATPESDSRSEHE